MNNTIGDKLLEWYEYNKRDLPWRKTRDPYLIWISEIILQQTRVDQGTGYYLKFVERFPDIENLAEANEQEVLNYWQGLGYYSRARNLHSVAKYISKEFNGEFPDNYEKIIKLKGIGPYTAAAISSICFNFSVPVLDGNVYRLITRLFGIELEINNITGKRKVERALESVFINNKPEAKYF